MYALDCDEKWIEKDKKRIFMIKLRLSELQLPRISAFLVTHFQTFLDVSLLVGSVAWCFLAKQAKTAK